MTAVMLDATRPCHGGSTVSPRYIEREIGSKMVDHGRT